MCSKVSSISTSSLYSSTRSVPSSRLGKKFVFLNPRFGGLRLKALDVVERRNCVIGKASSDDDSAGPYVLSESEDDGAEDLALDSKLQLKLERNMRMKFSKKIRMRRKKLGRKRLLRKKSTPSKLKKEMQDSVPQITSQASCANLGGVVAADMPGPETKKRELRGITKPRPVSPEMQALVHVPEIARTQVIKFIWTYIKENNLQDPENKKIIICDEKLKKIFKGNERVGFLEIAGLISPHFL
ncbi:upstream activation factor subunit UAF30 [Daucus carota subsp. sativus]|nr:PREDICTED: upstream activation factor subunit UAF30-like [Daucus carota subsp. sativus]